MLRKLVILLLKLWLLPRRMLWLIEDRVYGPLLLYAARVTCGKGVRLYGVPVVSRSAGSAIVLGDRVSMRSRMAVNVLLARPCVLSTTREGAVIDIEQDAALSGATLIAAVGIRIGARTMLGAEATLIDTDFHPLHPLKRREHPTAGAESLPIDIGSDAFIGAKALILKGVTIGDGAVIAAGAVVARNVPAGAIAMGNPARVIGWVDGIAKERWIEVAEQGSFT